MNPTSKRSARGQSMAMFSLTIMLVSLMVMMTLGFGMKAKEKMELQHIADAAAYSNAITVARTLNGVAILNRAEVAVMVTMAATQSHISFASQYLASLNAISTWIGPATIAAGTACGLGVAPCCTAVPVMTAKAPVITAKYQQAFNQYYQAGQLDHQAGLQARAIQGAATSVHQLQRTLYLSMQNDFIGGQKLAKQITTTASNGHKWAGEYKADTGASAVSDREVSLSGAGSLFGSGPGVYALSPRNRTRELGVKAAMGTRGNGFVRNRGSGLALAGKINLDLGLLPPGPQGGVIISNAGSGHWMQDPDVKHPPPGAAPQASGADDEGSVTGIIGNIACPASIIPGMSADSWVISNDTTMNDDKHVWTGGPGAHASPEQYHTMGDCTACPGVWTMFIDLNPDNIGAGPNDGMTRRHLWGQSKNMAVVRRDYNERCSDRIADWNAGPCAGADPWNLMFNFRFNPSGAGVDFDNRGLTTQGGDDISSQIALGNGITYYHRPGHWREPPNFFNPFWRATLVSPVVDSEGNPSSGTDIADSVNAGGGPAGGTARDVVNALNGQGFKGW